MTEKKYSFKNLNRAELVELLVEECGVTSIKHPLLKQIHGARARLQASSNFEHDRDGEPRKRLHFAAAQLSFGDENIGQRDYLVIGRANGIGRIDLSHTQRPIRIYPKSKQGQS